MAVVISWPGLERLIVLSANLSALLSLMLVLLATTPIHATFKAARALHLPRLLVLLLLLTYRYVFLLLEEFARHRGLELGIVTKSNLVIRDLELLQSIAKSNELSIHVTVTTLNTDLARILEQDGSGTAVSWAATSPQHEHIRKGKP